MKPTARARREQSTTSVLTPDWISLNHGIRLKLYRFEDGWGWYAWEEATRNGWQAFQTPAADYVARRFGTQTRAVQFFDLLGQCTQNCR
jgi:hypothetical protein